MIKYLDNTKLRFLALQANICRHLVKEDALGLDVEDTRMKLNSLYKVMKVIPHIALLLCVFVSGCVDMREVKLTDAGWKATMRGDTNEAIAIYSKLIEINPTYGGYYDCRAILLYQKGDYDHALTDYTKAINLYKRVPEIIGAYKGRGQCWFKKGNYEQALSDYNTALAQDFNRVPYASRRELSQGLYIQRSLAYEKLGLLEKAKEDAERAYDIAPGNKEAQERKEEVHKLFQQEMAVSGGSADRVSLMIENVVVEPAFVRPGSVFDLIVEHFLFDPSARTDRVHVTLTYRILAGQNVVFKSKPKQVESANGKNTSSTVHLTAARDSGTYKIEIRVEYNDILRGQAVDLIIK
jgi:tetratricopeptide (TPR) repeat protein